MVLNASLDPKDIRRDRTTAHFDFVVAERPKYQPGSGPPLLPISIMPPHDKNGFILDYVQISGSPRYLVGYDEDHLQVLAKPENILDWVSSRTLEAWEFEQTELREKKREEIELSILEAKEERRHQKELKKVQKDKSRAEQNASIKTRKRKRAEVAGMQLKLRRLSSSGIGMMPPIALPSGPARRHQPEEEVVVLSPRRSQNSQQPSLSTPSRGLVDLVVAGTDSEDEDSVATDLALDRQLNMGNGLPNDPIQLASTTASPSPEPSVKQWSRSNSMPEPPNSPRRESTSPAALPSPKVSDKARRPRSHNLPSVLSGKNAVATASSREALHIYEKLERMNNLASPSISPGFVSCKERSSSISSPKIGPTSTGDDEINAFQPRKNLQPPEEPEESEEADEAEEEYEFKAILDDEIRRVDGRRHRYYLIDWVGDWNHTWEPAENVSSEAIAEYQKKKRRGRELLRLDGAGSEMNGDSPKLRGSPKWLGKQFLRRGLDDNDMNDYEGARGGGYDSDPDTLFVSEIPKQLGWTNKGRDTQQASSPNSLVDSTNSSDELQR